MSQITVYTMGLQGPTGAQGPAGPSAVGSGGASVVYFLDETLITAGNYTLSPIPTGLAETSRSVVCNTTVNGGIEYLNRYSTLPLGGTAIEGGEWVFHTYAAASAPSGLNEIVTRINRSVVKSGITVTFAGTGAMRTVVATGGAPFVSGDATSSILTATLLRTANQTAWISSFVSSSEVVVTLTNPAYVNESGVALTHMYYPLFSVTTGDITDSVVTEFQVASIQPSFPIGPTDSIVAAYFGRTDRNNNRTLTLYYNGSTHYTHIETPLRIRHDDLSGLNSDGFMHLTTAEYAGLNSFELTLEAGEDLVAGDPVWVNTNKFYVADNVTSFRVVGVVATAALTGLSATAVTAGLVTLSGISANTPYFLGNGIVTPTSPSSGYVVRMGQAVSSTSLLLNIEDPILLS